jgi:hypothetical protein
MTARNRIADKAKQEQWLAEIAARPEISPDQLLGLFKPDLIERIDKRQRELIKDPRALLGFSALDGASKDDQRLFEYAGNNMGTYSEEVEDLLYEDSILATLTEPQFRQAHASDELFARAVRLRRTVVAHYLVSMEYNQTTGSDNNPAADQRPA